MALSPFVYPSTWVPLWPHDVLFTAIARVTPAAGTLVAANDDAHYMPVLFPNPATLESISFAAANGTGNYDLGFYDSSLAKIASSGSTAMTAAGVKTLSLSGYRVQSERVYYAALALSSTSGQVYRVNIAAAAQMLEAIGWGHEASALPLPATATPVTTTGYTVWPFFAFGIR